jgi:cytochrome P450
MDRTRARAADAMIAASPPRLRSHPLLGCALDLRRSQVRTYERAMREHGDVVRMVVGPPGPRFDLFGVFHPDGVKAVLAGSREGYSKRTRFYELIAEALGWGLLTSEGELWQRQRRLIQPLFTRKQIASYADLMADEAGAVAARWARAAADGERVDANAEMVGLALRVVGRAIFGDDVSRSGDVLGSAFAVLNRHTFRRAISPLSAPASWPTASNRRAARARLALYAVADELIAQRRQAGAGGHDLISRLLSARDPDTGAEMDLQQVRDEALIFLLGGHETTSTAMTFTLHLLAQHPDEQRHVRDEIDTVVGGRAPTVDDVPALQRTAMAIEEAMRLYPPIYALGRLAETEQEIGGYRIPAGARVVVSQFATHRHPLFWEQPETFDPARFTAERAAARHPYAYFPFGGGPRACIGSHFAMLEATIALAVLLQRFRIGSDLAPVPPDTHGLTLRPGTAVPVRVMAR